MNRCPPNQRRNRPEHMIEEEDVERLAQVAGLNIDPAHLPGVWNNLRVLLAQAELLMTPPLAAEVEPAPAYRA